ncbi:hypothetical protein SDRG_14593 [Saprolegnia diclina VS20]|uniref:Uncharacterized protein n=1 Tax=Saprolegnia diclina (strain VS20) TaxID=1156394 RepID=T0PQ02_SAPDV|nr:hypothetical protein SDRG_14593 [Saprolegnia diclina VS20]EQC27534.1 hypothetical protein SDRG_14593 [Saprolegnia diclina VS20]|eukprot:XP_008618954.1 hypothetical protein SDRG_14593 [Saprolegnia diclina VS20]
MTTGKFAMPEIDYLGHMMTRDGIAVDLTISVPLSSDRPTRNALHAELNWRAHEKELYATKMALANVWRLFLETPLLNAKIVQ